MRKTLSVIVPVYNEERTVGSIVQTLVTWDKNPTVYVVDDGSTDKSYEVLKLFETQIHIIKLPHNRGKSYAVQQGIQASQDETLMFLDADLIGLTHSALDVLLDPLHAQDADMVIGSVQLWNKRGSRWFDPLSGQRVVRKKDISALVKSLAQKGYGLELTMNAYFRKKKVVTVVMPHVYLLGKFDKYSKIVAIKGYIREAKDLFIQFFRQYREKYDTR